MKTDKLTEDFGRDLGLMHEVIITGRRFGVGRDDWSELAHNPLLLFSVLKLIRGSGECRVTMEPVDFSNSPNQNNRTFIIPGGEVVYVQSHGGSNDWGPIGVTLTQKPRTPEVAHPALACTGYCDLGDSDLFNSNHLDFFLKHPEMMPVEWLDNLITNGDFVNFIGTIFFHPGTKKKMVRCLLCHDGRLLTRWNDLDELGIGNRQTASTHGHTELVAYMSYPRIPGVR